MLISQTQTELGASASTIPPSQQNYALSLSQRMQKDASIAVSKATEPEIALSRNLSPPPPSPTVLISPSFAAHVASDSVLFGFPIPTRTPAESFSLALALT